MPLPRNILSLAGLPMLFALLTLPVAAQIRSEPPLAAADGGLVLTTMGQRLHLPAPDWVAANIEGEAVLSSFEAVFRSGDVEADLELYGNGAVYALATTRYGAHVVRDAEAVPASYRDAVVDGFGRACVPGLVAFIQLGDDPDDVLAPLLLVCGAQTADTRHGEIMAISLSKSEAGLAIVHQQWRGAAFDPARAEDWPAAPEAIEARARALQAGTTLTLAD
ncbi:hypothetical protein [Devosia sp. Root635]|uniref:hypothetical protein n=1 Tax=Devosia sp. Root635 TaxID=1736575 RepID=UPI0006FA928E|nr:hypothetical protein [Devosia sp. Root635]KRA47673.1 hypothetical protein ASD80_02395 [Devosia sp. Root635]